MQRTLIQVINIEKFLSIQVRYPSSQDPTSKTVFYCKVTKILTEQCGRVMSRWTLEYLGIAWYL